MRKQSGPRDRLELIVDYLESLEDRSHVTQKHHEAIVRNFLDWFLGEHSEAGPMSEALTDDTDWVRLGDMTAKRVADTLYDFSVRRRADGAEKEADLIQRDADEIVDQADSKWRDCGECGWPGTYFEDGKVRCPVCSWSLVCERMNSRSRTRRPTSTSEDDKEQILDCLDGRIAEAKRHKKRDTNPIHTNIKTGEIRAYNGVRLELEDRWEMGQGVDRDE